MVRKAWQELPEEKRNEYKHKANEGRLEKKATQKKRKVPFHTRCSLKGFKSLVDFVNKNESLKNKVNRIGFGALLKVGLDRLPHDLVVAMLRAYDPPTYQFRIRGKSHEIEATDVAKLLGIPTSGDKVRVEVEEGDLTFEMLKEKYAKKSYTYILDEIKRGVEGEQFKFLFVMYTLRVFLCPSSSRRVSDWLLRVMW